LKPKKMEILKCVEREILLLSFHVHDNTTVQKAC
jgi:hypothetical protein